MKVVDTKPKLVSLFFSDVKYMHTGLKSVSVFLLHSPADEYKPYYTEHYDFQRPLSNPKTFLLPFLPVDDFMCSFS